MTLSTAAKDPQACGVCAQSETCRRLGRCVKYRKKYGTVPAPVYTTPEKHPSSCEECKDSERCMRLCYCLKHKTRYGVYAVP